jgi:hypothetical protein
MGVFFLEGWHVPARLQVSVVERQHKLALRNGITATIDYVSDTQRTRVNGLLKTIEYDGYFPSLKLNDMEPCSQSIVWQPARRPSIQFT